MKILIADDDPRLTKALQLTLASLSYEVVTAADGAEAIRLAAETHPDLIMLDLGMPKLDGVDVITAVRGWSDVPILVVSGRTGSADTVEALDAGADDYVTKPFQIDELLARVRALGRRKTHEATPALTVGEVSIDLSLRSVTKAGAPVRLTPTEWTILEQLARTPGRLVTKEELFTAIWGTADVKDTGYLRLYIGQLRKKLERTPSAPEYILTEPGVGYRLNPPAG